MGSTAEQTKFTLRNTGAALTIMLVLASIVGAAYIGYDNAKMAKNQSTANSVRMQALETKQARFEGIISERTANTAKRVDDIYDIVKEWGTK